MDSETDTMYLLTKYGRMSVLKLKDNDEEILWEIKKTSATDIVYAAQIIVINGKLHVIGGEWNNKHLVYNEAQNEFDII